MATAKKAADAVADGLKAASAKLKGTKGSSRKNFKAETEKLDKAEKSPPKAPEKGSSRENFKAEAGKLDEAAKANPKGWGSGTAAWSDNSVPKPIGQNGPSYKPTAADKAEKVGSEALRMVDALPVGGVAAKGGRAALALLKAGGRKVAEGVSKAGKSKVAAGLTAGAAVGAAAVGVGGSAAKAETKEPEKTATGTANSSKLSADDVKTASKAMGTEGKTAPKKSSGGGKGGGSYPVYKKDSAQASDFRKAFASARKEGKSVFTWEGRKYNTKLKSK